MLLLYAAHREVGEAGLAVVVEGGLLYLVGETGVVAAQAGGEAGRGERVGEFVVEDAFGGEAMYEVVLDAVGHEGVVGEGCLALIAAVEGEHIAWVDAPREGGLAATTEKLGYAARTIGTLGCTAILHQAITLDGGTVDLSRYYRTQRSVGVEVLSPGTCLVYIYIIVVAKHVALGNLAVGVAQVVLDDGVGETVVAGGKLVDVGV